MTISFIPDGFNHQSFTARVEVLLGGIGQVIHPDNKLQFAEQVNGELIVYSPKLPENELEAFCKTNLDKYKRHYKKHAKLIDEYELAPAIEQFWLK